MVGGVEQNRGDDSRERADKWSQIHDANWSVHSLALGESFFRDPKKPGSAKQHAEQRWHSKRSCSIFLRCSTFQAKWGKFLMNISNFLRKLMVFRSIHKTFHKNLSYGGGNRYIPTLLWCTLARRHRSSVIISPTLTIYFTPNFSFARAQ